MKASFKVEGVGEFMAGKKGIKKSRIQK